MDTLKYLLVLLLFVVFAWDMVPFERRGFWKFLAICLGIILISDLIYLLMIGSAG